jgi:hypothetical protein
MFLQAHRILRGVVLGLMFLLAAAASCSCDRYDPDPYDDIPPVVTVDFNYVVPHGVNLRRSLQAGNRLQAPSSSHSSQVTMVGVELLTNPAVSVLLQNAPRAVRPLRC